MCSFGRSLVRLCRGVGLMLALLASQAAPLAAKPAGADALSETDWAAVQAQMLAHRHRAEGDAERGYRARNDGLGLAQHYHPDGRTEIRGERLSVSLRLTGYGRGEARPVAAPMLTAESDAQGAVVRYRWDENLREWWHNRPGQLEQWFELERRPEGAADAPLRLDLALGAPEGEAVALDEAGQTLRVGDGAGALRYAGLKVWDADGRALPARLHLDGDRRLSVRIDDRAARYPLTIDPSVSQQAYIKASNTGSSDYFGVTVAVSGDTLVVGAPFEDSNATGVGGDQSNDGASDGGAAYVFVRVAGAWSQQAYLKASNTGAGDNFGWSVAVSGDTLVVGAYGEDSSATGVGGDESNNAATGSGAAYVFVRSGTTWSQQAYLKASNTQSGDRFSESVAVSGDTLVVGADGEDSNATGIDGDQTDNSANFSGAAYVFVRSGTTWSQQAYLKASNTGAFNQFGFATRVSGDTLVVGAIGESGNSGAAYVFARSGASWSQQAYLKASNAGAGDQFGWSVAVSGDTLVVGAPNEASNATGVGGDQANDGAPDSGAAYVFVRSGTSWSQQAYLKASNTGVNDLFGRSVAVSGNILVVGAPFESSSATGVNGDQANDGASRSGAAYAFVRAAGVWGQQAYLKASNTQTDDWFGFAVVVSGDTLVVGAIGESSNAIGVNSDQADNSALSSGAAYVFNVTVTVGGTLSGLAAGQSVTLQNNGGDDLVLGADGAFTFATPLGLGAGYNVTVLAQPAGQTCTVSNGGGTAATDVTDVVVNCVNIYPVGGTLSGLAAGQTVTLQNNGGDDLVLGADGAFTFAAAIAHGAAYSVTVLAQPAGQTCTVGNGGGTVTAAVASVTVACATNTYPVGGTLSGLAAGQTITLQNNGGDDLALSADGAFAFAIAHGAAYRITVLVQPVGQTCTVSNGTGTATAAVANVTVACVTNTYPVGGVLSGLATGQTVTLQNNGGDDLVLGADGAFTFATAIAYGAAYNITVLVQPAGQICTVINGSGTVGADGVGAIGLSCVAAGNPQAIPALQDGALALLAGLLALLAYWRAPSGGRRPGG